MFFLLVFSLSSSLFLFSTFLFHIVVRFLCLSGCGLGRCVARFIVKTKCFVTKTFGSHEVIKTPEASFITTVAGRKKSYNFTFPFWEYGNFQGIFISSFSPVQEHPLSLFSALLKMKETVELCVGLLLWYKKLIKSKLNHFSQNNKISIL